MRALKTVMARVIVPLLVFLACAAGAMRVSAADPLAQPIALSRANWGAGRCSSTACHGSPTPVYGSRIFRNEHTVWASRDQHANAFQTLYSDLSRSIAQKIGQGTGRTIPAHQDSRCLACHSTPGPAVNPELAATIRQDGVGCESCHGSSGSWLAQHTTYDWDLLSSPEKEARFGKVRLDDLVVRAERCVACHVGVPARDGLPAREVDHDLIAAGHPRLNFEFSSFLANLPAHWVETGQNAASDFPARTWAIGQLISGRTALELLESRAKEAARAGPDGPSRWPEFSEYDCASCHQDLRSRPSGTRSVGPASPPGIPAWGTWYFPLISTLAEHNRDRDPAARAAATCLGPLRASMNVPLPDSHRIAGEAGQAAQALERWLLTVQHETFDPARSEPLLRTLRATAIPSVEPAGPGWDGEAQIYLGLVPLRQALGPALQNDPGLLNELRDRRNRLLAPYVPDRAASGTFQPLDGRPRE
ncbi:Cytochrome c554 and c-prime [Singulisphaera sp. GP187]|uniref:multiheme c-type cytochrome n=1 Tax=Singulisphaera sp. GP187 TaxID=1882752 RepID=UPI00092A061E|nr:multiheme c-type cytochrome [Singulisphaera sp. GP187]SIN78445.1 Cytochrome c554 and c-prime [Singulisphaera sp. GP187]